MRGKFSQSAGLAALLLSLLCGWRCYRCHRRRWRMERAHMDGRHRDVCPACRRA